MHGFHGRANSSPLFLTKKLLGNAFAFLRQDTDVTKELLKELRKLSQEFTHRPTLSH